MWIEIGLIDYKILIPLLYPLFYEVRLLLHKGDEKVLFNIFMNISGYLFSGVIYLIIKFRMRRVKSDMIERIEDRKEDEVSEDNIKEKGIKIIQVHSVKNQIEVEKEKLDKKKTRNQYLFLSLLVFIFLIPVLLDVYISFEDSLNIGTSSSVSLFFYIFFFILLSVLILGDKLYTHQIFSIIIIVISIVTITIIFFIKEDLSLNILTNIVIIIIVTCLFALFNILQKKYYNIYMDSPYHFMFIIGLFAMSLILLYEIFTVIIFGIDRSFNGIFYQFGKNFEKYNGLYILIFIGDVLSDFLLVAGIQLTIYYFTPCHFIISESTSQIISTFVNDTIEDFPVYEKVIIYFLFIIIFFATLIYNEVLIIKICSLNENTKKYIALREANELEYLITLKTFNSEGGEEAEVNNP